MKRQVHRVKRVSRDAAGKQYDRLPSLPTPAPDVQQQGATRVDPRAGVELEVVWSGRGLLPRSGGLPETRHASSVQVGRRHTGGPRV